MTKLMTVGASALGIIVVCAVGQVAYSAQEIDERQVAPGSTSQTAPPETSRDGPRLVVDQSHVDLGVVRQGGTYDFSYVLTNAGDANLLIRRIRSTCGCTVTRPNKPQVLEAGEQLTIDASFDSTGRVGLQKKTIEVYSNDPLQPQVVLTFGAEVEAVYQLRPNIQLLRFENKRRGETLRPTDRKLRLLSGKKEADIQIVDLSFSTTGITYTTEPIIERGYNGHRLTFTLQDDVPIGPYETEMRIIVECDGERDELRLPFAGRVISDITVSPPYLLELAPVPPGGPITSGRITLRAVRRSTPFLIHRVDAGEQLTHAIEETEQGLEYRITFKVAQTAASGPFARNIVIFTNNKEQPVITLPIFVNIGSSAKVRPEIVYLRREAGDLIQSSRTVFINSRSGNEFSIEGASCDNPAFVVALQRQGGSASTHELITGLAESVAVGNHRGTITVFTNLRGAKELRIPVYGEVLQERQ